MKQKIYKLLSILLVASLLFTFCGCVPTHGEQPDEPQLDEPQLDEPTLEEPQPDQPAAFKVTYVAGAGGRVLGKTEQTVEYGKDTTSVTVVADYGYTFVKWSDGLTSEVRQDRNVKANLTLTATFTEAAEPMRQELTFDVDYKMGVVDNPIEKVTFVKDAVGDTELPVPTREHFTFGGWYVGETQVTDKRGAILVDNEILRSHETSIYAKWTANETFTYKVLIVYVTRVQATLPNYDNNYVNVDYTMSAEQEQFYHATTPYLKMYLDEMMDGMVEFQVDEYFTTEALTDKAFHPTSGLFEGHGGLGLWAYDIPELAQSTILDEYDSVLVSYGLQPDVNGGDQFNDGISGGAYSKYAEIIFDRCWHTMRLNGVTFAAATECMQNFEKSDTNYTAYILEHYWVETFIHELAHTIVMRVENDTLDELFYRSDTTVTWGNVFQILKEFYFDQALLFGEKVGIPYELWAGKIVKITIANTVNDGSNCYTRIVGHPMTYNVVTGKMDYTEAIIGDEITSTVKLYNGYKFANWSDGVTTITRTDTVTADMTLTAIVELAEYTITVNPSEGGSFSGYFQENGKSVYLNNTTLTGVVKKGYSKMYVSATAYDGYRFVGWSDGVTNYERKFDFSKNPSFVEWFDETYTLTIAPIFEKLEE